jgi:2-haloacid dehalogenase
MDTPAAPKPQPAAASRIPAVTPALRVRTQLGQCRRVIVATTVVIGIANLPRGARATNITGAGGTARSPGRGPSCGEHSSRMARADWLTFDCYGTLIDWEAGVADALGPFLDPRPDRRTFAARYIAIEAQVEHEAYRPYRDVLAEAGARLMRELGNPLPPGRERLLPDSLPGWRPFPEVPDALRRLREDGYRIAVLSNVDRDLIDASVGLLGVTPDLIITAEDCRSYKPAPGHWTAFQTRSGSGPARTIHVGASVYHDMIPAGALGYRTVFINRHRDPVAGAAPTRVLTDLALLPETVADLASP